MHDENDPLHGGAHQDIRHELRDVTVWPIVGFCIGLFLLVVFSFWVTWVMFDHLAKREATAVSSVPFLAKERPQVPPEPRLQVLSAQDQKQVRAAEESVLNSYGWVNQSSGIVRIPIERAMELIVERGLPSVPASEAKEASVRRSK